MQHNVIQLRFYHIPTLDNYMNGLISKLMTYVNGFVLINYHSMPKTQNI